MDDEHSLDAMHMSPTPGAVGAAEGLSLGELDGLAVDGLALGGSVALQSRRLPLDRDLLPPVGQLAPHPTASAVGHADTLAL